LGGGRIAPIVNPFKQTRLVVEMLEDRVVPTSPPIGGTQTVASPIVGFQTAALTPTVYMGDLVAVSTVALSGTPSGEVTVNYATSDGTAAAGTDYAPESGTLTFEPGQASQTIEIPILGAIGDPNNTFDVTLSNPSGAVLGTPSTQTITFSVANPVSLANPGNQSNYDGDTVSLATTSSDAIGNSLTYSDVVSGVDTLPPGLSIDPNSGVISGTIATNADANGPYAVTITATDSAAGVSATQTFDWPVSPVNVILADPSSHVSFDGDSVSFAVNSFDPAGNALSYSATGLPTGLSIDSSTGVISGTISTGADSSSPYQATITATDSAASASTSENISWAVLANSVTVTAPNGQLNAAGDTVDLPVVASNPAGHALTFTASGLPDGLAIDSQSGAISGTVADDAISSTPYSVTVTASDGATGVDGSATFAWSVDQFVLLSSGTQTNFLGDTVDLPLQVSGTASGAAFTAQNLPDGLTINSTTGVISGTVAADAAAGSPYSVVVSVSAGGATASQTLSWNVNAVVISTPRSPANATGDSVSLTINATAAYGDPVAFSATGLPDGLSINASTGLISGTVAADAATTTSVAYTVTVAATDSVSGASAQSTFEWDVFPAPATVTVQYFPLGLALVVSQGQDPRITGTTTREFDGPLINGRPSQFRWLRNQGDTAWSLQVSARLSAAQGYQWYSVRVGTPPAGAWAAQGYPQGWGWVGGHESLGGVSGPLVLYVPDARPFNAPPPIPQQQPAQPPAFRPIPNNQAQAYAARRVERLYFTLLPAASDVLAGATATFIESQTQATGRTLIASITLMAEMLGDLSTELNALNNSAITNLIHALTARSTQIQDLADEVAQQARLVRNPPMGSDPATLRRTLTRLETELRQLRETQASGTATLRSSLQAIINGGN
jgi:hypothetical protein